MSNLSAAAVERNRSNAPSGNAAVDTEYEQLRHVYTLMLPLIRCCAKFYLAPSPHLVHTIYSKNALRELLYEIVQVYENEMARTLVITEPDMMNYSKLLCAKAAEGQIEFQNFISTDLPEEDEEEGPVGVAALNQGGGARSKSALSEMLAEQFTPPSQRGGGGGGAGGKNAKNAIVPAAASAASSAIVPSRGSSTESGELSAVISQNTDMLMAISSGATDPRVAAKALQLALPSLSRQQVATYREGQSAIVTTKLKALVEDNELVRVFVEIAGACGLHRDLYSLIMAPEDKSNQDKRQMFLRRLMQQGRVLLLKSDTAGIIVNDSCGNPVNVPFRKMLSQVRDVDPELASRLITEDGLDLIISSFAAYTIGDSSPESYTGLSLQCNIAAILLVAGAGVACFRGITPSVPLSIKSVHEGRTLFFDRGQQSVNVTAGLVPVIKLTDEEGNPIRVFLSSQEIKKPFSSQASVRGIRDRSWFEAVAGETPTEKAKLSSEKDALVDKYRRNIKTNNAKIASSSSAEEIEFLQNENKVFEFEASELETYGTAGNLLPPNATLTGNATVGSIMDRYVTLGRPIINGTIYVPNCTTLDAPANWSVGTALWWGQTKEVTTCEPYTMAAPSPSGNPAPAITLLNVGAGELTLVDQNTTSVCKVGESYDQMTMQCTPKPPQGILVWDATRGEYITSSFLSSYLGGYIPGADCYNLPALAGRYGSLSAGSALVSFGAASAAKGYASTYGLGGVLPSPGATAGLAAAGLPLLLGSYDFATQCVPVYVRDAQSTSNLLLGTGGSILVLTTMIMSLRAYFKRRRQVKRVTAAKKVTDLIVPKIETSYYSLITKHILGELREVYLKMSKAGGEAFILPHLLQSFEDIAIISQSDLKGPIEALVKYYKQWKERKTKEFIASKAPVEGAPVEGASAAGASAAANGSSIPGLAAEDFVEEMSSLSAKVNQQGSFSKISLTEPEKKSWTEILTCGISKWWGPAKRGKAKKVLTLKEWFCDSIIKAVLIRITRRVQEQIATKVIEAHTRTHREYDADLKRIKAANPDKEGTFAEATARIELAMKIADQNDFVEEIILFNLLKDLQKDPDVINYCRSVLEEKSATTPEEAAETNSKTRAAELELIKKLGASSLAPSNTKPVSMTNLVPTYTVEEVESPGGASASSANRGFAGTGLPPKTNNATASAAYSSAAGPSISSAAKGVSSSGARAFIAEQGILSEGAGVSESKEGQRRANPVGGVTNSGPPRNGVPVVVANRPPTGNGVPVGGAANPAGGNAVPIVQEAGRRRYRSTRNRQVRKTRGRTQLRNRTRKVRRQRSTRSRKH